MMAPSGDTVEQFLPVARPERLACRRRSTPASARRSRPGTAARRFHRGRIRSDSIREPPAVGRHLAVRSLNGVWTSGSRRAWPPVLSDSDYRSSRVAGAVFAEEPARVPSGDTPYGTADRRDFRSRRSTAPVPSAACQKRFCAPLRVAGETRFAGRLASRPDSRQRLGLNVSRVSVCRAMSQIQMSCCWSRVSIATRVPSGTMRG